MWNYVVGAVTGSDDPRNRECVLRWLLHSGIVPEGLATPSGVSGHHGMSIEHPCAPQQLQSQRRHAKWAPGKKGTTSRDISLLKNKYLYMMFHNTTYRNNSPREVIRYVISK